MPPKRKFTRLPRADELIPQLRECGVGLHVLPTYWALVDHGNNRTGVCWPSINRLASILGVCRRTVERHLEALVSAGLVLKSAQRRGRRGRFSVCRYCVVALLFFKRATVRHQGNTKKRPPISTKERNVNNVPPNPQINTGDREADAARRSDPANSWFFE